MKVNYSNISQKAAKQGYVIDRKKYLHIFFKCIEFDIDEIEDIINPPYNLREYEETADFHYIKGLLQPVIERKLKDVGYNKIKLGFGDVERVEWNGEGMSAERAHRDIMVLYDSIMNADKTQWTKDEIDRALKIIKEYDEKFGLFNSDEKEKNRFDSHFYHVYKSFNSVCPRCNSEIDIIRGVLVQCPVCEIWIDTRENESDANKNIKVLAGEHGKTPIKQIDGDKNITIEYPDHYKEKA